MDIPYIFPIYSIYIYYMLLKESAIKESAAQDSGRLAPKTFDNVKFANDHVEFKILQFRREGSLKHGFKCTI